MTTAPAAAASAIRIRNADESDLPAIQRIYASHVLNGLASFEETAPDVTEMARRRAAIVARRLPYLVGETGDAVQGFAYCAPYRTRAAYRYSVEDSVYVAAGSERRGLGRALLAELIERATALGYRQMVAIIGGSRNDASIGLHESLGFQRVGTLTSIGWKFGGWVDSVLMQRALGSGDSGPP